MGEILLTEYQPKYFETHEIDHKIGEIIWQNYQQAIDVEVPSFKNKNRWKITAKGVIGTIPLTPDCAIRVQPKTSISNIWNMLDTVGNLPSLTIFKHLANSNHLEDLCDILARTLADRILDRVRQGLVASYQLHQEQLISPRGRINWQRTARSPWQTRLPCQYATHTTDLPDNQILLWTLHYLRRTRCLFCDATQTQLARAYHALIGSISLIPYTAKDCRDRFYDRLNYDYHILHALCRFFLENLGPDHQYGDRYALPFLLNTAQLYEAYVATWLEHNLPTGYRLKAQDPYRLSRYHRYCGSGVT